MEAGPGSRWGVLVGAGWFAYLGYVFANGGGLLNKEYTVCVLNESPAMEALRSSGTSSSRSAWRRGPASSRPQARAATPSRLGTWRWSAAAHKIKAERGLAQPVRYSVANAVWADPNELPAHAKVAMVEGAHARPWLLIAKEPSRNNLTIYQA